MYDTATESLSLYRNLDNMYFRFVINGYVGTLGVRFSSLPSLSVPEGGQIAGKSISSSLGRAVTAQVLTSQLRGATGTAERECVIETGYEPLYLKTLSAAKVNL